jgi:hypothetical protein
MSHLIKPITTDHQLIELAKIIGVHLDGILALQEIKTPPPRGSYLILLGHGNSTGHWTAMFNDKYFDSEGEGPPTILGRHLKYNEFQYQGTYSSYCGIWSILWLYCQQHNKMDLLKGFTDLSVSVI